jgi:hypothetical protein
MTECASFQFEVVKLPTSSSSACDAHARLFPPGASEKLTAGADLATVPQTPA